MESGTNLAVKSVSAFHTHTFTHKEPKTLTRQFCRCQQLNTQTSQAGNLHRKRLYSQQNTIPTKKQKTDQIGAQTPASSHLGGHIPVASCACQNNTQKPPHKVKWEGETGIFSMHLKCVVMGELIPIFNCFWFCS